jgi:CRISPR system Cascade subunit CasB
LLIQAVKIRGGEGVNILSLADSIFLWMDEWYQRETHKPAVSDPFARNRIRWASEYLSTSHAK